MLIGEAVEKCREAGWQCTNDEGEEQHHIVAQGSMNPDAVAARVILAASGVGINTEPNLVSLPYRVHRRLHTNAYYLAVNDILQASYNRNASEQENNTSVVGALGAIRDAIVVGTFPS